MNVVDSIGPDVGAPRNAVKRRNTIQIDPEQDAARSSWRGFEITSARTKRTVPAIQQQTWGARAAMFCRLFSGGDAVEGQTLDRTCSI